MYNQKYPVPKIPIKPILSFGSFRPSKGVSISSVLDVKEKLLLSSGRIALAMGLQSLDIKKGQKVLVPAYHCTSMVYPIIWIGAQPLYYKINKNLSADLDDIKSLIDRDVHSIIVVHYFGFPQDVAAIRDLCDQKNIYLIEDCAHSFFGEVQGKPIGSYGDYAIASAMKFFTIYDGGCLLSSRHSLANLKLKNTNIKFNLKALVNIIERSTMYNRFRYINIIFRFAFGLRSLLSSLKSTKINSRENDSGNDKVKIIRNSAIDGGYEFEPSWMNVQMSSISRVLLKFTSKQRIIDKRRKNYITFLESLSHEPGSYPLFDVLPEKVVPYVFPLYVENVDKVFPRLKMAGVPIYRWEDILSDSCERSLLYSKKLLQFPCHQELEDKEINWMIKQIQEALRSI